jgi:hypothetical protein
MMSPVHAIQQRRPLSTASAGPGVEIAIARYDRACDHTRRQPFVLTRSIQTATVLLEEVEKPLICQLLLSIRHCQSFVALFSRGTFRRRFGALRQRIGTD